MISSEERAYVAALLDGEGSINLQTNHANNANRSTSCILKVRITNTYRPVLDWLYGIVGGHLYTVKKYSSRNKQAWSWEISGQKAVEFLTIVYPFLRIKKAQAETAFMFGETLKHQPGKLSDGICFVRRCLQKRLSELNHG